MKVNQTIFMGDDSLRARHGHENPKEDQGRKTIFAGGLKKVLDPIQEKREQAQKQAMKIVGDTWGNDQKLDDDLDNRREKVMTSLWRSKTGAYSFARIWELRRIPRKSRI